MPETSFFGSPNTVVQSRYRPIRATFATCLIISGSRTTASSLLMVLDRSSMFFESDFNCVVDVVSTNVNTLTAMIDA